MFYIQHFFKYVLLNNRFLLFILASVGNLCIMNLVIVVREEKKDLRIVRTKKFLYEGLIQLLKERPFEEVKVSDICEKAYINRSTFYAHYSDKYDLLDAFIKDLKLSLAKELEQNKNISNSREYYLEMLHIFLEHVESKKAFYSAIMVNNQNSVVTDMIYDTLNEDITRRLEEEEITIYKNVPSDVVAKFYLGAVFNIGVDWLKNTNRYTTEELFQFLQELIPDFL